MKSCNYMPLIRSRCYSALTIRFILRICQYMRSGILQSRAAHSVTLLFVFDYSSSAFVNICAVKPCNHVPVIQSRCYSALIIRPQRLSIYAHHTPLAICFVRPRQFVLAFSELETPHFKLTCMRHCKWHRQPFVICRLVHVDVVDSRTASHAAYKNGIARCRSEYTLRIVSYQAGPV